MCDAASAILLESINSRLEYLELQVETAVQQRALLQQSGIRSCVAELRALACWYGKGEFMQNALALERALQALADPAAKLPAAPMQAFFMAQLRIQDAARSSLRRLWQARLENTLLYLHGAAPLTAVEHAALIRPLQHLQKFITAGRSTQSSHYASGKRTCVCPAPELQELLCADTQSAEAQKAQAALELQQQIALMLEALANCCTGSAWTLSSFVASALAHLCARLLALTEFAPERKMRDSIRSLLALVVVRHIRAQAPAAGDLQKLLYQCMCLALGSESGFPAPLPCDSSGAQLMDAASEVQARAELARYLAALEQMSGAASACPGQGHRPEPAQSCKPADFLVTENLLLVSYKLAWVLQACKCQTLSDLSLAWYQLYLRHWSLRLPLSPELLELAAQFRALLAAQLQAAWPEAESGTALLPLMCRVLLCWPQTAEPVSLLIPLGAGAQQSRTLTLEKLPEYLSRAFPVLLSAQAAWFENAPSLLPQQARLQEELTVLEQGAAAYHLLPLESFAARLLDVYQLLELLAEAQLPGLVFPGDLLWRGHQQLINMLDRAAAWQEARAEPALDEELANCLLQAKAAIASELKHRPQVQTRQDLQLALYNFVQDLARVLQRPVRLRLLASAGVSRELFPLLLSVLSALLRWLLLQAGAGSEPAPCRHKPQAICLQLQVTVVAAHSCRVELHDASSSAALSHKQLQRLQKLGGAAVRNLVSTVGGEDACEEGRRLVFEVCGQSR